MSAIQVTIDTISWKSAIVAISEKKSPERNTRACPSNVMRAGVSFLLRILYFCLPQAEIAEIGDNSPKLFLVSHTHMETRIKSCEAMH